MDKVTLVGNLGRDPEMRYTPTGSAVCNFSVAANRQWKDANGEQVKQTIWYRVSTWGKLAEVCNQYLKKGRKVLVEGRLNADPETGGPRIWTGQDGVPRASFEVTAATVEFLSGRGETEESEEASEEAEPTTTIPAAEDVPF